jgi:membrane protease subunit HflK
MAGNSGGPWGGGGGSGGGNRGNNGSGGPRPGGPRRPGGDQQIPEIDEIVRKGQEQLRVLMGGRGGRSAAVAVAAAGSSSPAARSASAAFGPGALGVQLLLHGPARRTVGRVVPGRVLGIGNPGLNFAPWPLVTAEVIPVTRENRISIGTPPGASKMA